jgi:hypothetical protein
MQTISGKKAEATSGWHPVDRANCTEKFLGKLDKRRTKNKAAKKSRKKNR